MGISMKLARNRFFTGGKRSFGPSQRPFFRRMVAPEGLNKKNAADAAQFRLNRIIREFHTCLNHTAEEVL
jgi:hypothetical protein